MKRGPVDVVAVDVASTALKAVRLKRVTDGGGRTVLVAAMSMPSAPLPAAGATDKEPVKPIILPKNLGARYVSIAITGKNAVVKLLNFIGKIEETSPGQINEMMGLDKAAEYRISYRVIHEGHGRTESKVLTVALPEAEAQVACQLFPLGLPAPYSVEISGLAVMSSFLNGPGQQHSKDTVGVIDFGAEVSYFALFSKGILSLIRKFDCGSNAIMARVQKSLGVDVETARGIVSDGSFDISQPIVEVMEPFVKQLVISRDFLERRENCRVSHVYVSGGITTSRDWLKEVGVALGLPIKSWNPFEGVAVLPNAVPPAYQGKEAQFAAAMGAGLATFEGV